MPSTVVIFFSAGASAAITKEGVKKPTRQMAARAKLNLLIHKRRCMEGLLKAIEITLRLITNRRFGDAGQVLSGKRLDLAGGKPPVIAIPSFRGPTTSVPRPPHAPTGLAAD